MHMQLIEMSTTGGGALKYSHALQSQLGVQTHKADELACLVDGINFLITITRNELYRVDYKSYMSVS